MVLLPYLAARRLLHRGRVDRGGAGVKPPAAAGRVCGAMQRAAMEVVGGQRRGYKRGDLGASFLPGKAASPQPTVGRRSSSSPAQLPPGPHHFGREACTAGSNDA